MSVETILKELTTLSSTDLKTIKTHIDFLTKNKKSSTTAIIAPKKSGLKNVLHLCAKRYVSVLDISILEKNNPLHMDDKLENAAVAIEQIGKELNLDRRQLLKLCQVIVEASTFKVKDAGYPLSFATILVFIAEPKSLLEESFPGYVGTSLFRNIVLG